MTTGMADPFPGDYDAADPYGNIGDRDPAGPGHLGSDWPEPVGTPAPAICRGEIMNKGTDPGNGGYLTLKMGDTGLFAGYIHSDSIPAIGVGTKVRQGDIIFYTGNSGTNSHGGHLHLTISDSEEAWQGLGNKVDPYAYIMAHLGPDTIGNVFLDGSLQLFGTNEGAGSLFIADSMELLRSESDANAWRDPSGSQLLKAV